MRTTINNKKCVLSDILYTITFHCIDETIKKPHAEYSIPFAVTIITITAQRTIELHCGFHTFEKRIHTHFAYFEIGFWANGAHSHTHPLPIVMRRAWQKGLFRSGFNQNEWRENSTQRSSYTIYQVYIYDVFFEYSIYVYYVCELMTNTAFES